MLSWDKEAIIQPKTIHLGKRPLFRDVQTPSTGRVTPTPQIPDCQCRESSSQHELLRQYCDGQQTQNPGRVEKGVPCLGWVMQKGLGGQLWVCGFGAPPGARLFPRQRCRSAVAAHTAGTESSKGNWAKVRIPL